MNQCERFADLVMPEPNSGCWLWMGTANTAGYGQPWDGSRKVLAHRYAFERAFAPIPKGQHVLHRCDTPACVNPDHLFVGTDKDNARDKHQKGRDWQSSRTHCRNGHPYGGDNLRFYRPAVGGAERVCRECTRIKARRSYWKARV